MTEEEQKAMLELHDKTIDALAAATLAADGTRAAVIALSYALAQQASIDARQLYEDAKDAIESTHGQDDPVPTSATEFLAQLYEALKK